MVIIEDKNMRNPILYTIALTLLSSAIIAIIECSSNDSIESKTPRGSVEIGPFKFEAFYNETNLKNKLRLNKSYFKFKVADKLSPDNLYLSIKLSRHEELVPCDNLTLGSEQNSESLDCQPIEAHLIGENKFSPSSTGGSGGGYIRRSSVRSRKKLPKPLPSLLNEYYLYPLKKDLIDQSIDNLVEEHNLTNLDFTDLRVNLGYYFEIHFKLSKEDKDPVICSGKVFLSINRTEILTRYSNDSYPEFMDEMQHFFEQGSKNGYLLSLQEVWCPMLSHLFMGIEGSFTIIQRLKFPYLSVRHTMGSTPLNLIIDYTAQVNQTLAPEIGPFAYNTKVEIRSRSALFDMLKFDLTQEFANTDLENGAEKMMMVLKKIAINIDALWNANTTAKTLKLSLIETIYESPDEALTVLSEALKLSYLNEGDKDEIVGSVRVKRKLLEPINRLVKSLIESASKVEQQLTMNDGADNEIRDEL